MHDILVSVNGIPLSENDWVITKDNDLQLLTYVAAGDKIQLRCGPAYIGFTSDGNTNKWHLHSDVEKLRFNNFMFRVYDKKDQPTISNLLGQLRTAMGLIE